MDISFSARFENILKITAYRTDSFVGKGNNATDARDKAKFLESEILKNAQSSDEYQELCNELLTSKQAEIDQQDVPDEPDEWDEVFNTEGPMIGQYEYSTFHKDGQMSTIMKAQSIDRNAAVQVVALKITTPAQLQPPHNSGREARLLVEARHESVVELLESFWYRDQFVLVFPFLRQDLENLLRSGVLTQPQGRMALQGLFSALAHIHSLGIIHRDIKPSNILLKTMRGPVYLADFGIAWSPIDPQSEASTSKITDVGTTCYRPPELLFGDKKYGSSLDMWAAGCVVAEIVRKSHRQLFDPGPLGSELGLIKSIFTTLGTPNEKIWPSAQNYPDWGKMRFQDFAPKPWSEILEGAALAAVDLVKQTVCYESTQRLSATQALQHPLMTNSW